MSEENEPQELQQDELQVLKSRADTMGISYHPSIGVDKLRAKVESALGSDEDQNSGSAAEVETTTTTKTVVEKAETSASRGKNETESQFKRRKRDEANELIRIRLTCMDPNKREHEGVIVSAGNSVVGTYKKFVPFNADEGWHVPRIIYNQLVQKQCQVFVAKRDRKGNTKKESKLIKAYSIEVLPPLTEDELKELGQRQAMAHSVE